MSKYLCGQSRNNKRHIGFTNFGCDGRPAVQQGCAIIMNPAFSLVSSQYPNLQGRFSTIPHPKHRRTEMSTTSRDSGSPPFSGSFNNNTNSFNTTINNVSNHSTVPEDRSEILAWLSPLEPRVQHKNLEASRVDNVGG